MSLLTIVLIGRFGPQLAKIVYVDGPVRIPVSDRWEEVTGAGVICPHSISIDTAC